MGRTGGDGRYRWQLGNSYAMSGEMGWHGNWNAYAARNGIVCRPGTYFRGADGLRHLCQ
jgi:hypothetical protein